MVFNATFNNISVISWRSVLFVEETTDLSQVTDKLYHMMLYQTGFKLTTLVVIGTTSNYHTIKTTTAPRVTVQSKCTGEGKSK
jgi:hypothetical protein